MPVYLSGGENGGEENPPEPPPPPPGIPPYSDVTDLLIGDIMLGNANPAKFVQMAADEINTKLGFLYQLPLTPIVGLTELPIHERMLLKTINNRLASGRLILTLDAAGEQTRLHAYGLSLVRDAMNDLLLIANDEVRLSARRIDQDQSAIDARTPSITNYDEESLLLGFEQTVMKGRPWWSEPGKVT